MESELRKLLLELVEAGNDYHQFCVLKTTELSGNPIWKRYKNAISNAYCELSVPEMKVYEEFGPEQVRVENGLSID
jgi:hypothetical protein